MSRPAIPPLSVGATAPEALSLLHQRLLMAEEEAESLIRDMGTLGVSRDQILGSAQRMDATQRPVSPLKVRRVSGDEGALWRQCDALVSRVCRMESLLQTLKLTVFRLETERQLDPSHTAHLEQQLAALQQDSEEERQACRREVMKLREQLHQAYQERDEALTEVQRLEETVGAAAAAKMEVALAAEELKIVKLEMSQKLTEMQQQMRQESARSAEAMKSHSEFLQRVEEMERAVEMERRQALMLRSDCQALRVEVRTGRQQLAEEEDRVRQLEERCQQLTEQTVMKDSLVSELRTELKAERSRAVHQLQQQDLQLEAATRSIQTELQVALTDKVNLQLELQKLTGEHAQLLQSSSTARETASTQRELLERTIERLRGELSTARREEGAVRKDLQSLKNKLSLVVTKLEGERSSLETQLTEAKEAGSLSSALQRQQDENRRLMGKVAASEQQQQVHQMLKDLTASEKGNLKVSELEALQCVCGPAGGAVSQTLASQTLQQELSTLKTHRVQAQREIRNHQAEVEKLQRLLTSTHAKNNRALESLQKASDSAKVDNKKLAQSLEQAVLTNSSLRSKLEQTRDQYQAAITLRDEELREARTQISHLSEELGALKQQTRGDYESSMKTLHREISELKHTVKASAARSGDLSKANQELHQRVSELERLVSKQKACIREHRSRLRQQHMSRDLQDNCQEDERFEERTRNLHEEEQADHKPQEVRMDSQQVLHKREAEWERWTSTIQRWEAKRELAHIAGGSTPVRTQLTKQSH
ncbi:coiled-coil domain-containing protein 150 isoform X2 [Epinephelus fuscoguttatus]|uniref:coiled-coil domain-containing protein 150 isoform X2 n=1 Tax=Epinephelus fuscoguttatus TaxID=293821 RepID=UPI0020D180CB|nr:coiled-coil domain-containing protein 150 isoform X2 [Epinephelus fuscoguttatus]